MAGLLERPDRLVELRLVFAFEAQKGEAMMVNLSRPLLAASPITTPRRTPGLAAGGALASQALTMGAAMSKIARTSRPSTAAGTMPKLERAE